MLLARVVGNVVSTAKDATLAGKKLLIVQPIDVAGRDRGSKLVALDSVGAGAGETVYCCRGREAGFPWFPDDLPTDCTIVGIVDRVNVARPRSAEAAAPPASGDHKRKSRRKGQLK